MVHPLSATQVSLLSSSTGLTACGGADNAGATGAAAAAGAGSGITVAAFGATLVAFASGVFGDVVLST